MTETRLRAAIAGLALVGLAIAAYLTYTRYSGAQIACATGGCEPVQQSRYAEIAGIPVAVKDVIATKGVRTTAASKIRGTLASRSGGGRTVGEGRLGTLGAMARVGGRDEERVVEQGVSGGTEQGRRHLWRGVERT